jgi:hypothetical protein
VYGFFTIALFAFVIYPSIPEQFGGGRSRSVEVLISQDAREGIQELGIPLLKATITLDLLFEGSNFYVFQADDDQVVRVDKSDVLAIRLDENLDDEPPDEYPVWDYDLGKCRNGPQQKEDGKWVFTSSPSLLFTQDLQVNKPMKLSIRNLTAKAGHIEAIRLTIVKPPTDTRSYRVPISATKVMHDDEWITFNVPKDFRNVKNLGDQGSYTVIWSSRLGLIACSGFYLY